MANPRGVMFSFYIYLKRDPSGCSRHWLYFPSLLKFAQSSCSHHRVRKERSHRPIFRSKSELCIQEVGHSRPSPRQNVPVVNAQSEPPFFPSRHPSPSPAPARSGVFGFCLFRSFFAVRRCPQDAHERLLANRERPRLTGCIRGPQRPGNGTVLGEQGIAGCWWN